MAVSKAPKRKLGQIIYVGKDRHGRDTWQIKIPYRTERGAPRRSPYSETIKGTRRDAEKRLALKLAELYQNELPEGGAVTLAAFTREWLDTAARSGRRAKRTVEDYQSVLTHYVLPSLGSKRLDAITPRMVQATYNALCDGTWRDKDTGKPTGRMLSPRTVEKTHATLRAAFNYAIRQRMLTHNPTKGAEVPRPAPKVPRALSQEQVNSLLDAARGNRFEAYFILALDSGARPGELLALRWRDVDLEKGTICISRALTRVGGKMEESTTKTRQARTVKLEPETIAALREHKARQESEHPTRLNGYVFPSSTGAYMSESNLVNRYFKPLVKAAKLPSSTRLYDLRHTCATLAISACGVDPGLVGARLGHKDAVMTLRVYHHALPDQQAEVAAKLGAVLFGKRRASGAQ